MNTAASPALSGLRVLVTRPQHQADALCAQLEALGAEVARMPLFDIEAVGDVSEQQACFAAWRDAAAWIFTSTNAVRLAAERDPGPWPLCYGVGPATAAALSALDRGPVMAPEAGSSSEALLALPELEQPDGGRFLIVTGEQGRDLLATTLQSRGAIVETLNLYRRRAIDYDADRVTAEIELADATILTSGEALDRLWALTPEASHRSLLMQQVVVPSARVLDKARELGFPAPLVPETVSDEAIVRCLVEWHQPGQADSLMTESQTPTDSAAAPEAPKLAPGGAASPRRRGSVGAVLAWMLVLLLTAALGYGGWWLWEQRQQQSGVIQAHEAALRALTRQSAELDSQTSQLSTRQSDLARVLQREGADLAGLQGRMESSEQLMGRISDELQGGRTRFALASIEQLLVLANDRLLLEHDVPSALLALEMANERLGRINDPRLFGVREAIADERSRLQAMPRPDLTSISLALSSLVERAEDLPLRARAAPRRGQRHLLDDTDADVERRWMQQGWDAVRQALAALFVIRRDDNAAALRLLPAEDEAVLVHVLILRLESARVAALRGETGIYRDALHSAAQGLRDYFRADDPGVIGALAEIERLQSVELAASPPDITRSLGLLREALDQTSGGAREP